MNKKLFPLFAFFLVLTSCTNKQNQKELATHASAMEVHTWVKEVQQKKENAIKSYIKNLTPEEKISQLFIINLEGCTKFRSYENLNSVSGNGSQKPLVAGGYLFFSYNIADSRQEQKDFMATIFDYCQENNVIPPFLAVDQEGGWVNRLKKLNTKLPSQEQVAQNYSISQAYDLYYDQAQQMADLGFHMNLAPVMEVCTDDNKDFLDGRSFGDFNATLNYGKACINGYQDGGIAVVLKHFPGNTNTDPHTGLPEISLSKDDLLASIEPFVQSIKEQPVGILMSHARTTVIDGDVPACLSNIWVTELLRNKYEYNGIIFSDDIFMGALADNGYGPEKAVIMAVEAGIDCIMISEKRFAKPASILYTKMMSDNSFAEKIDMSVERIIKYKLSNSLLHLVQTSNGEYEVVL